MSLYYHILHYFFVFFPITTIYNGRQSSINWCFNYRTIFFKYSKECVTTAIVQRRSPFKDLEKWDTKESIQKTDQWNNLHFSKNWKRLVPCGNVYYKPWLNGQHFKCHWKVMNAKMMWNGEFKRCLWRCTLKT